MTTTTDAMLPRACSHASRTRCACCVRGTPRRSRAFARGDGAALADLYVAGSRTGAADRAVLRGYRERGLRVTGMRTQVLSATVMRESESRIVLLVTDVLTDAVAVAGAEALGPAPRPSLDASGGARQEPVASGGSPRPTRSTDG